MVSTRPEIEAAEAEYQSFLTQGGLSAETLRHVLLEEAPLVDEFSPDEVSGIIIGGSPYGVSSPSGMKTRSQLRVEEGVSEMLAAALKGVVPVLATGFGLEVLLTYLGGELSPEFAEPLGATTIYLSEEGQSDPVLAGLARTFTTFVGHHEGAAEVPEPAVLLASSADCPVQMIRVGSKVYGTQFNPELDAERFEQRMSIYADAGYGDAGQMDNILAEARSGHDYEAGRIIRNFVEHFARD